jgi:NhaP-type Na+/H+ or K+/H+ antiporter
MMYLDAVLQLMAMLIGGVVMGLMVVYAGVLVLRFLWKHGRRKR